jgi:hypothetical protein
MVPKTVAGQDSCGHAVGERPGDTAILAKQGGRCAPGPSGTRHRVKMSAGKEQVA